MLIDREKGQMTVEFAVIFPVFIVLAAIAVNALLLFSECASFDNIFRDAVRVYATSPAFCQNDEQSKALIAATLDESFNHPFETSSVSVEQKNNRYVCFSATLEFFPTLFGHKQQLSVFGVKMPPLTHSTSLVVDCYRPGISL